MKNRITLLIFYCLTFPIFLNAIFDICSPEQGCSITQDSLLTIILHATSQNIQICLNGEQIYNCVHEKNGGFLVYTHPEPMRQLGLNLLTIQDNEAQKHVYFTVRIPKHS